MTISLAGILVWEHSPKRIAKRGRAFEVAGTPAASTESPSTVSAPAEASEPSQDDRALENLCKQYYAALNDEDAKALQELTAESCRSVLTIDDFKKLFKSGSKFEFLRIEPAKFRDGPRGARAAARAKRVVQTSTMGIVEGWHEFKFVEEHGKWKIFRWEELTERIVAQFSSGGFTKEVRQNIELLRDGDPFGSWDKNDTNAIAAIFKSSDGRKPIFPWEIRFTVASNRVHRSHMVFNFTVQNNSLETWDSPLLEFDLKAGGKLVARHSTSMPTLRAGQEAQDEATFLLNDMLQDPTEFQVDVFTPTGIKTRLCLIRDLTVKFNPEQPAERVKFEVVSAWFDRAKSQDLDDMWCGRVDYRVKNVRAQPVSDLTLKCVWSEVSGEMLDQSAAHIIGHADVPLGAGQTKSGFIRCGTGYKGAKVPVKVDIYLESEGGRNLVIKGLTIK